MISQKDFLTAQGIDQFSSEEQVEKAKKLHRKYYVRNYQKAYNKVNKSVKLSLNLREYNLLHNAASKHGKKVATFGKECVIAYLNEEYIVPDEEQVERVEVGLRRIGNNINQIARWLNQSRGDVNQMDVNGLYTMLGDLQIQVSDAFRKPDNLLELLSERIDENPALISEIRALLDKK